MIVPFSKWEPVPSHSGPMSAHQGLVLHVQVGNNDCYGEFANPSNQASSTWWISKAGGLVQYVDSDMAAWTEAAGNFTWDSVETEGYTTEALTNPQILTLARLYVWGAQQYGWPLKLAEHPADSGLGWHGMGGIAWGGHFGCPGNLRKAQRAAVIYIASLALNPPTPIGLPEMDNQTFVRWAYLEYLVREPDPGGLQANLNLLDAGGTRAAVIAGLVDSPEGQNVLNARRKALGI